MSSPGALAQWLAGLANSIHHSDPIAVGIAVTVLAAGSAYCSWRTWRHVSDIRLIQDTPTARIRSAPQGYVELEGLGKLMDGPPIIAKLSGLPCVWFRYKIEELVTAAGGRGSNSRWETIDRGESTETFWLQDDTGRVVVDPEGAEITPRHKDVWRSGSSLAGIAYPGYVRSFLTSSAGGRRYRFTEERINSGERLYALGQLKNISSYTSMPTVDEDVRALLDDWKKDQPALLQKFDLDHNGKIDQTEWMLARAQARREVMKSRTETTRNFTDGLNLLGPTHDRARPYILSAFTQSELARRYRLRAMAYAAGCFLLGLATVWVFNAKFI
ncbi:MAG: GIDE domain-containing protein [Sulfuricaulis sp.]